MKIKNKITFTSNSKNINEIFENIELFYKTKNSILNVFNNNLLEQKIKKVILLNLFFSFYEDSFRNLMNFNIKNLFSKNDYNFLSFKLKNEVGYNFKMPKNEKYFYVLKNSLYHQNFRDKHWNNNWKKWIKNNSNRIKIFINQLSINEFLNDNEDKFLKKFIEFTNIKIRETYKERNDINHSFEKWFDKSVDTSENYIFALFILLVLNLMIFDFYINDSWKNKKNNFSFKNNGLCLRLEEKKSYVINKFYEIFIEFVKTNPDLFKNKNIFYENIDLIKNNNLKIKIEFNS